MSSVRDSVVTVFHDFTIRFEGDVPWMYLDVKGLVTTGDGNLIDTPEAACALPWRHKDGRIAERPEIAQAWAQVKAARPGLDFHQYMNLNDLRLTEPGIEQEMLVEMQSNADYITKHHFPGFPDMPADAQLGIMSMAWACGPGFPHTFLNFARFAERSDWGNAAACSKINETGNPGVVPRNKANLLCFQNAAVVVASLLDPEVLNYPAEVLPPVTITPESEA